MTRKTIYASDNWTDNGDLVADVLNLYAAPGMRLLDATYGRGIWWSCKHRWPPTSMEHQNKGLWDFYNAPFVDASWDVVLYDPPYVCKGGRATSGVRDMDDRYGLTTAPASPRGVQDLVNGGLTEMARITAPKGIILCKVQDYISSGKLWPGTYLTQRTAYCLGLEVLDIFVPRFGSRPQPSGRTQMHARRNISTLFVFRKGKQ